MNRGERARADILDAAERLIAERGIQVPLRDIAIAAGQRNNSAVNYHFRNRQDLIDAVVRRRLEPMEGERAQMLEALADDAHDDVRAWLRIMVLPLTTVGSPYYARFLQAASLHLRTDESQGSVWPKVLARLAHAIPTGDRGARRRRVKAVATTMFALLAERERSAQAGDDVGTAEEIIAMLAAALTTPMPVDGTLSR
ncbi:TetR/AcrR family transcriptional regulator [Mycobacterium sp. 2YAF39]|uniref:TetR/AcrR family transcriptional regulator n=1 Tax=Mycobacterium sp. 2YAF39 TaxID=3233033 RepID=UPI003F9CFBE1